LVGKLRSENPEAHEELRKKKKVELNKPEKRKDLVTGNCE
jgi:hypothetical protein